MDAVDMEAQRMMPEADMTGANILDPMDDLFGEATDGLGVNVAMPTPPLTAPLLSRISDMKRIGSCS